MNKSRNAVIPKNKMPQFENELNNTNCIDVLQTNYLENSQNLLKNICKFSNASKEAEL